MNQNGFPRESAIEIAIHRYGTNYANRSRRAVLIVFISCLVVLVIGNERFGGCLPLL